MNLQAKQDIINGSKAAYADLYADYYKKFYNYGRKFTANAALIEDCIQEVFLDFWINKQKLSEVDSFNGYLFSSFRYVLFRKMKQSQNMVGEKVMEAEPEFSIDHIIISRETGIELQQKLQSALAMLTARQREVIFLRFYETLSYEEVAAVMNISVKATYKIMARSLATLKENIALPSGMILILLYLCLF